MTNYIKTSGGLSVDLVLHEFIENELLPIIDIPSDDFWEKFAHIIHTFTPKNTELLKERQKFSQAISNWLTQHPNAEPAEQIEFLSSIGYLVPEPDNLQVCTTDLDPEIADIAGPQLVVPIDNARYCLNAANARWGSLYDALYGSDAIADLSTHTHYDQERGQKVIQYVKDFLDTTFPLEHGSHCQAKRYYVQQETLYVELDSGLSVALQSPQQCVAYTGSANQPDRILFINHGLHVELQIDQQDAIGQHDAAGIKDVLLESALSTIMDFEDSIAAVDAQDKVLVYQNWLGLMQHKLIAQFEKNGQSITRRLHTNRVYTLLAGGDYILPGLSLMLVRNSGLLMRQAAILDANGEPVYEGIMDGVISTACALMALTYRRNSRHGSMYIVKPKLHGPAEVAFTNDLFSAIEQMFDLAEDTLKMGIMDEERRTSLNLAACIGAAKSRVFFINTGFLDRTGDEINTCMQAGPIIRKNDIKQSAWIKAYETQNVELGLRLGMHGVAQIGKGMWAMPDLMRDMLSQKIAHPKAGATTAWVPSPTAATLHALHYHQVDVKKVQQKQLGMQPKNYVNELLTGSYLNDRPDEQTIQEEIDNNVQGILGYVVRWVEQGIGCSKVPDIYERGLMEDRATLRISSQHIANWLKHGICQRAQVEASLLKMAAIVDQQNAQDPNYRPMATTPSTSLAFQAAHDLIFKALEQPNGYTEPLLYTYRSLFKQQHPSL